MAQKRRARRTGYHGKNLADELAYYRRRLDERLLSEYARDASRGGGRPFGLPKSFFNNLQYEHLLREGTTRNVNGKTIQFKGEEAVRLQIESLKRRSNKMYMHKLYIKNYLKTMYEMGFSTKQIRRVQSAFRKLSADRLTYGINSGIIRSIQWLYNESVDYEEETEEILESINKLLTNADVLNDFNKSQQRYKQFYNLYKQEFKILQDR